MIKRTDANPIVTMLDEKLRTFKVGVELVGSLSNQGYSSNDIDILILGEDALITIPIVHDSMKDIGASYFHSSSENDKFTYFLKDRLKVDIFFRTRKCRK